ncbi:MAG: hypothetical protein H6Q14_2779 [Bacteroidetes bacterium]|nr:hypothetical protein [Bacteroidota bacterium]
MKKKELKLKKEKLSNLTNLNTREMEELKGGALLQNKNEASLTVTVSLTWSWTVTW